MSDENTPNAGNPGRRPARFRRDFLKQTLGIGAAGAAGLAAMGRTASAADSQAVRDTDIMNFALNLEYLEAEYYTYAVTGNNIEALGIATNGAGTSGPITIKTNPKVLFATPAIQQYAVEIALDEQKHVQFFRSTLAAFGVTPVARPAIDLLNSFNTLAQVAGLGTSFDPFANETNFLLGAYIFEDVGVSAFHGAARLIKNKDVLDAAAGILAIEAYHSGLIRTVLFARGQGAATQAISNVRKALGGSVDYGVAEGPLGNGPAGTASVVLADSNAIAANRTARQVLNIVYGGVNASAGLFFPNGLNGNIR